VVRAIDHDPVVNAVQHRLAAMETGKRPIHGSAASGIRGIGNGRHAPKALVQGIVKPARCAEFYLGQEHQLSVTAAKSSRIRLEATPGDRTIPP
jgi:hypothetical protein